MSGISSQKENIPPQGTQTWIQVKICLQTRRKIHDHFKVRAHSNRSRFESYPKIRSVTQSCQGDADQLMRGESSRPLTFPALRAQFDEKAASQPTQSAQMVSMGQIWQRWRTSRARIVFFPSRVKALTKIRPTKFKRKLLSPLKVTLDADLRQLTLAANSTHLSAQLDLTLSQHKAVLREQAQAIGFELTEEPGPSHYMALTLSPLDRSSTTGELRDSEEFYHNTLTQGQVLDVQLLLGSSLHGLLAYCHECSTPYGDRLDKLACLVSHHLDISRHVCPNCELFLADAEILANHIALDGCQFNILRIAHDVPGDVFRYYAAQPKDTY